MAKIFIASNEYAESNPDLRGAYVSNLCKKGHFVSNFPDFQIPKIPWVFSGEDRLYSVDGTHFVAERNNGILKYFGSTGKLANFPAQYYVANYPVYDTFPEEEVRQELMADNVLSEGDVLGWFDMPETLAHTLSQISAIATQNKLKAKERLEFYHCIALIIKPSAVSGVQIELRVAGAYIRLRGGMRSTIWDSMDGTLGHGVRLVVRGKDLFELKCLKRFLGSGVQVRATESHITDEAVLAWTSPSWDGTLLTTADIDRF